MKQRPHVWFPVTKGLPHQFCGRCGIITLRNKATQRVIQRPCQGREDD